jgi:hypothetical protein
VSSWILDLQTPGSRIVEVLCSAGAGDDADRDEFFGGSMQGSRRDPQGDPPHSQGAPRCAARCVVGASSSGSVVAEVPWRWSPLSRTKMRKIGTIRRTLRLPPRRALRDACGRRQASRWSPRWTWSARIRTPQASPSAQLSSPTWRPRCVALPPFSSRPRLERSCCAPCLQRLTRAGAGGARHGGDV